MRTGVIRLRCRGVAVISGVIVFVLGLLLMPEAALAATSCKRLSSVLLRDVHVDSADVVARGRFVPSRGVGPGANPFADLPEFCRVTATLTPARDSLIRIEVWLPAKGWNGKFQAVGNGGWAGGVEYAALADALRAGYAAAGTDTGHMGGNADFALGHPEKLTDFGYRAVHEMAVAAKFMIGAHYGRAAGRSYFNGCSTGGRQGLAEAQLYPGDFDGIVAGAPAWDQMRMHASRTALNLLVNKDVDSVIPASKYEMIYRASVSACDALDGVRDGVIENPAICPFDYTALLCKVGDSPDCLTPGQVESAQAMISPLKSPVTGEILFQGHLMPGAELGWATLAGPQPLGVAVSAMKNIVFQDANWDYRSMNIATDIERAARADNGAIYTGDPDLTRFFDRGGKLLMYHGWADPQVTPLNSTIYYDKVVEAVGKDKAANSIALFMVPGMSHCSGGPGTDSFDKMKTIENWVERGATPIRIVASHWDGSRVDKTRPLCPYGEVAAYQGSGDTKDAANFSCAAQALVQPVQ